MLLLRSELAVEEVHLHKRLQEAGPIHGLVAEALLPVLVVEGGWRDYYCWIGTSPVPSVVSDELHLPLPSHSFHPILRWDLLGLELVATAGSLHELRAIDL